MVHPRRFSSRIALVTLTILTVAALIAPTVGAQTEYTGQTESGAYYRILVPQGWVSASGLVVWNHGFDLSAVGPNVETGPLTTLLLSDGYAVAASSYSLNGWALFQTLDDNQQLYEVFTETVGVPDRVFLYGASLGGLVTAQAIEGGGMGNVVGAMPLCGVLGGSRVWNGALDLRMIYDYICADVPGAAIPGGARGLPFPPDPSFDEVALATAVNLCTGVDLPAAIRTAEQQARLDRLLALSGLPENFITVDMGFATFALADLIYDPRKMGGIQPVGNSAVDYGDVEINAGVVRASAEPAGLRRFLENYTPTGRVGETKIVSLHTDKDGLVLLENESEYAAVVPAENLTVGVVVEDEPSHCDFNNAEVVAAWESLKAWVAGAAQPTAQSLQATCEALVAGGLATGPCRIDPDFAVPDLNDRVRPRARCDNNRTALCLGEGRFKVEITWEDFEGNSGPGRTTPLRTSDTGSFYFFDPDNVELMVKVLDGRQNNGRHWVFYGSLTNVAFELTVTDTETGQVRVYSNSSGSFASNGDIESF